ncbi:hypothetical protein [Neobacillus vireti]|uniref:hypothetical protein n=1 Tax=Neobacillus vireti TaxID=220686 RepID=UPI002FFFB45F
MSLIPHISFMCSFTLRSYIYSIYPLKATETPTWLSSITFQLGIRFRGFYLNQVLFQVIKGEKNIDVNSNEHRDERKLIILNAAKEVFIIKGFNATTIQPFKISSIILE